MQPLVFLWYSSILCSVSAPGCMLEPFMGKFFFFFFKFHFSLWRSQGLGYYLMLAPSYCSQGIQGIQDLTLRSDDAAYTSLPSPHSLVAVVSFWANSPLAVEVRHIFCVLFSPVTLPSEIPKLPTDPPVNGVPNVWKLLLLHDSFPRTGLHP